MISPISLDNITVDTISFLFEKEIEVSVLRLDRLHPDIPGNKWFKLRYYLEEARAGHKTTIITFGGAWSNHIIATAAACKMMGLRATGIIRGEEPATLSPTLLQAREWDMQLVFIPRSAYREKYIPAELLTEESYVINEGGYGEPGARGAATITDHCSKDFTHYCCAAGTGTMMAGLINAATGTQQVIGIPVLKNNGEPHTQIQALLTRKDVAANWQLVHDYHFGGYAKSSPELFRFMNHFYEQTGIPSDFVYTGKLFYAVTDLIRENFFAPGSKLLLVHSGGLQGNASLRKGTLIF
jgi:1-aminocyclopropane-1-carboxylate deaminase